MKICVNKQTILKTKGHNSWFLSQTFLLENAKQFAVFGKPKNLLLRCLDENTFSGCGRMHVERKRCNQPDLRKKGEQMKYETKIFPANVTQKILQNSKLFLCH